jgi:hypothetical protein
MATSSAQAADDVVSASKPLPRMLRLHTEQIGKTETYEPDTYIKDPNDGLVQEQVAHDHYFVEQSDVVESSAFGTLYD